MPAWITSLLRELVSCPKAGFFSRITIRRFFSGQGLGNRQTDDACADDRHIEVHEFVNAEKIQCRSAGVTVLG
jgi:hypothetical protein